MTRAAWLLLVLLTAPALAEPLELHVITPSPRSRTAAPMILLARFESEFGRTYHGHLHLRLHDEETFLLSWRSGAIVLTGGEQTHRIILPPMMVMNLDSTVRITARFIPRDGGEAIYLGEHVMPASSALTRNGVIAVCDPWGRSLPRHMKTIRALRLDQFDPAQGAQRMVNTTPAHVSPHAMPTDPLGYCSFDVVALIGEGFASLEPAQLDAIAAWTRAGGSTFVAPGRGVERLSQAHRQFLRDLGDEGRNHVELGRAVIDRRALSAIEDDADSEHQRAVTAFLWKLTEPQRAAVVDAGAWRTDIQPRHQFPTAYGYRYGYDPPQRGPDDPIVHRPMPTVGAEQLSGILQPGEVRIIPFGVIALIMGAYVLAIGPVDYLLLGAVRKRKWTWLLFPVVTAAFTWATVELSNQYVGRTDYRRTLTVIDVGATGRVLRETQVGMIFTGVSRDMRTQHDDEIFTPLNRELQAVASQFRDPRATRRAAPVHYAGRFPYRYETQRTVRQWSPQFSRTLRIAPDRDVPIDLTSTDIEALQRAHPEYDIRMVRGERPGGDASQHDRTMPPTPGDFVGQLTARQTAGHFAVVSQIAPAGGDSFEDLAIVDPLDPNERAIVATRADETGMTVYRRKLPPKETP